MLQLRGEAVRRRRHLILPHQTDLVLGNILLRITRAQGVRSHRSKLASPASRAMDRDRNFTSSLRTSSFAVGAEMMMRRASSFINPSFTAMSMKDSSGS